MAAFVFLGTDDPAETSTKAFGHEFVVGEPVEVSDAHAVAKLANNHYFKAVDGPKGKPPASAKAKAEPDEPTPASGPDDVEIPAGWDELPFLSQKALAKKLDPTIGKDDGKEAVQAVIEAELIRRAKA